MKLIESVNKFVWGIPALIMILGVGLFLSFRTGFAQFSLFPRALRLFSQQLFSQKTSDKASSYRALCTALAATVGTGNIIGVAGAIAIGGPGAIFWMWVSGLLGMVTKFAEATLAVRYRKQNQTGLFYGGPMYMIQSGLGKSWSWLAGVYSVLGIITALGVGNATQVNAVVLSIKTVVFQITGRTFSVCNLLVGIILAIFVGSVLLGGAKKIGQTAEKIVPIASAGYLLLCAIVLVFRWYAIPQALERIVIGAFQPDAVTGGAVGSVFCALRVGASRGTFTNEAGMGTASIAHADADVDHPVIQGMMGIMEVFLDTIVICTMTALAILCSGIRIPYGQGGWENLTAQAFCHPLGAWVEVVLASFICCFAVATILGWSLYGARCAQFLFGEKAWYLFASVQTATVIIGALMDTEIAWLLAETFNGLMAIPNLIALIGLSPEFVRLLKDYTINFMPLKLDKTSRLVVK